MLVSEKRTNISSEADHDDVGVIDAMLFEKGDKLFTRIARRQENLKGIFEFNKPALGTSLSCSRPQIEADRAVE